MKALWDVKALRTVLIKPMRWASYRQIISVVPASCWKRHVERIDVENPNPGQRPGQLHYQDNKGNKYLYDPQTNSFPDAPKSVNNLLNDSSFKKAIDKGMTQYLGEKK